MEYMGEGVRIVNPAYEAAMDLKKLLKEKNMNKEEPVIFTVFLTVPGTPSATSS